MYGLCCPLCTVLYSTTYVYPRMGYKNMEYRNIQFHLPYLAWQTAFGSIQSWEAKQKNLHLNTQLAIQELGAWRRASKSKIKHCLHTEPYELENALIDESRTAGDTGILGRLVPLSNDIWHSPIVLASSTSLYPPNSESANLFFTSL
jgi:hypothetical protein